MSRRAVAASTTPSCNRSRCRFRPAPWRFHGLPWCRCASRRAAPARAVGPARAPCASGTTASHRQWPTTRRRQPHRRNDRRPGRRAVPAAAVPAPAERRSCPVVRRRRGQQQRAVPGAALCPVRRVEHRGAVRDGSRHRVSCRQSVVWLPASAGRLWLSPPLAFSRLQPLRCETRGGFLNGTVASRSAGYRCGRVWRRRRIFNCG